MAARARAAVGAARSASSPARPSSCCSMRSAGTRRCSACSTRCCPASSLYRRPADATFLVGAPRRDPGRLRGAPAVARRPADRLAAVRMPALVGGGHCWRWRCCWRSAWACGSAACRGLPLPLTLAALSLCRARRWRWPGRGQRLAPSRMLAAAVLAGVDGRRSCLQQRTQLLHGPAAGDLRGAGARHAQRHHRHPEVERGRRTTRAATASSSPASASTGPTPASRTASRTRWATIPCASRSTARRPAPRTTSACPTSASSRRCFPPTARRWPNLLGLRFIATGVPIEQIDRKPRSRASCRSSPAPATATSTRTPTPCPACCSRPRRGRPTSRACSRDGRVAAGRPAHHRAAGAAAAGRRRPRRPGTRAHRQLPQHRGRRSRPTAPTAAGSSSTTSGTPGGSPRSTASRPQCCAPTCSSAPSPCRRARHTVRFRFRPVAGACEAVLRGRCRRASQFVVHPPFRPGVTLAAPPAPQRRYNARL